MCIKMSTTQIRTVLETDRDWLVEQHQMLYARDEGFDDSFVALVAEIFDDFIATYNPKSENGWIVEEAGQQLGCIFCVRLDDETAQLRLFLLVPEARGKGLGRLLLETCMGFAREKGYSGMRLWTHRSHEAACRLYRAAGWRCVEAKPDHHFGQDVVVETYTYRF